jgi:hypothetical protein
MISLYKKIYGIHNVRLQLFLPIVYHKEKLEIKLLTICLKGQRQRQTKLEKMLL